MSSEQWSVVGGQWSVVGSQKTRSTPELRSEEAVEAARKFMNDNDFYRWIVEHCRLLTAHWPLATDH